MGAGVKLWVRPRFARGQPSFLLRSLPKDVAVSLAFQTSHRTASIIIKERCVPCTSLGLSSFGAQIVYGRS